MLDHGPAAAAAQDPAKESMQAADAELPVLQEPATLRMRTTRNRNQLNAWALVLTSKGVSPVVHWRDGGAELHVMLTDAELASRELDGFDAEESFVQRSRLADAALEERRATRYAGVGSVLVALLLVSFFAVTGPRADGSVWFSAGASDASQVLQGEWWRTVTALTLHADSAHVLSNVAIGTLVVGAVMRSEGVGWGGALVLASGALGNLANAWAHHHLHRSVGFSTAVFGAIGILGGLAYVRGRRRVNKRGPAWAPIAGSLALLALLGTGGERTDLFAHLFGGMAGLGLGVLVAWSHARPRTVAGQFLAGFGALATVSGCWYAALSG